MIWLNYRNAAIAELDKEVATITLMTSKAAKDYLKKYRDCGIKPFTLADLGKRALKVENLVLTDLQRLNEYQAAFPRLRVLQLLGERIPRGQSISAILNQLDLTCLYHLPLGKSISDSCYVDEVLISTCLQADRNGRNEMIRQMILKKFVRVPIDLTLRTQIATIVKQVPESSYGKLWNSFAIFQRCFIYSKQDKCRAMHVTSADLRGLTNDKEAVFKINRLVFNAYLPPKFPTALVDLIAGY